VLDFGSQYTQLIARRIRELNVFSIILPWDVSTEKIRSVNPKGVILSGGPESVTESNTPRIPKIIFELDVPVLGICYGMQTLAEQFGGQVSSSKNKEFGHAQILLEEASLLFDGFSSGSSIDVWMSHGDHVSTLPDEFNLIASTASAPIAAMEHAKNLFMHCSSILRSPIPNREILYWKILHLRYANAQLNGEWKILLSKE
jgi:GMP synthase (glutamine-hydrolysing)